ncbi:hypothetical protein SEPCBS57363_005098 [Sporothrix epigloea]|uniref:Uncharacterized protein n=1 Tax=Sporothrix epigloea TaxID=1892477 RepID=A0ABP0DVP6_9PEZI
MPTVLRSASGVYTSFVHKQQAGPALQLNKDTMQIDTPAPLVTGRSVGNLAYVSIVPPKKFTLPVRRAPVAKPEDGEDDSKVEPLSDAEMIDLFGPFVPSDSTSVSTASTVHPSVRVRQGPACPVDTQLTTGDRYYNPIPSSIVYPTVSGEPMDTGNSIDSGTERARHRLYSSRVTKSSAKGSAKGSAGPFLLSPALGIAANRRHTRARSVSSSAIIGLASPPSARPRNHSQGHKRRPSLHKLLALPGATNPFFVGTSPSIMTPPPLARASSRNKDRMDDSARRDSLLTRPPPRP